MQVTPAFHVHVKSPDPYSGLCGLTFSRPQHMAYYQAFISPDDLIAMGHYLINEATKAKTKVEDHCTCGSIGCGVHDGRP